MNKLKIFSNRNTFSNALMKNIFLSIVIITILFINIRCSSTSSLKGEYDTKIKIEEEAKKSDNPIKDLMRYAVVISLRTLFEDSVKFTNSKIVSNTGVSVNYEYSDDVITLNDPSWDISISGTVSKDNGKIVLDFSVPDSSVAKVTMTMKQ